MSLDLPPTPLWEQRWHPLREEWVIVAAHRQTRPWVGERKDAPPAPLPRFDPDCYLCPGNPRASGARNPDYAGVHVFDNDFPCVGETAPEAIEPPPPYRASRAHGIARVICYSPRHDLTVAEMSRVEVAEIVRTWQRQTHDLAQRDFIRQVLVFENKGAVVGVSNPHPHGQIYATNFVWKTIEAEFAAQRRYLFETGRHLFADIIAAEQRDGRRVLYEDERAIAFVPYFARYAYEVYVAPKRRAPHLWELDDAEAESLASALLSVAIRFDNLWRAPFPYVMPLHQAPVNAGDVRDFHAFIGFLPPLRQPGLLKYLAGPEIGGGNFLSDTSPEAKAAELRALPDAHFRHAAA